MLDCNFKYLFSAIINIIINNCVTALFICDIMLISSDKVIYLKLQSHGAINMMIDDYQTIDIRVYAHHHHHRA